MILALVGATSAPGIELRRTDQDARDVRHVVFLARELPRIGGGGNQQLVSPDGCASQVRVVTSLDPGGLDEEARILDFTIR
jgi:hypothetical protein